MSTEWQRHGFVVSTSEWPLVRVQYPAEVGIAAYRELFAHFSELASRGERVVWLVDMRSFDPLTAPASTRRAAAEVFEEHRATLTRTTVCEARVIDGAITRGVLTAFDWLTPNKWPCTNVATETEARAWIATKTSQDTR